MRFIVAAFTEKYAAFIYEIIGHTKHIVRKYITGLFLEMIIVAVIAGVIFLDTGNKIYFSAWLAGRNS